MTFCILTLGCKVNQSESDAIEGQLVLRGHTPVSLPEKPDICIVNTCSVTARSDHQSRQLVRRALRSSSKVIVTGCFAELRPHEIEKIDRDIHIVSNIDKSRILNMLEVIPYSNSLCYSTKSRPYIKIQDGCNFSCSYCIVPKARGKSRSIPEEDIIQRVFQFEDLCYNEVVLTGIHLGSYGKDLDSRASLSRLLETLLQKTKISRIRISSVAPNDIDERLIDLFKESRICNHLHIPLQSADDSLLKRMSRPYTQSLYRSKMEKILLANPAVAIGTDVIVGFPGETDASFLTTKNFLEEMPFAYLHNFPFSLRPGTTAASLNDHIPAPLKKKRLQALQQLRDRKMKLFTSSQVGKTLDIIIEEVDSDGYSVGTSSNYLRVRVHSHDHHKKSLISVRVTETDGQTLVGKVV